MSQQQLVMHIPIRRGMGRAGLRRKVPGTNPLLKPKLLSQSPQIERPILPSQEPQIPSVQRAIHPTSVGRKQIIQQLNHRSRVQPRSEVKSREVT